MTFRAGASVRAATILIAQLNGAGTPARCFPRTELYSCLVLEPCYSALPKMIALDHLLVTSGYSHCNWQQFWMVLEGVLHHGLGSLFGLTSS